MILILTSVLEPRFLHKNFKDDLIKVYKDEYENKSLSEGYIVKIKKIEDIVSSVINNNNDIIVKSKCECEIFNPIVGDDMDCNIDLIHINGVFMSKYGIKIIVPSSDDYKYNSNYIEVGGRKFRVGDNITIRIVNVRYDKFTYSCIGKILIKD